MKSIVKFDIRVKRNYVTKTSRKNYELRIFKKENSQNKNMNPMYSKAGKIALAFITCVLHKIEYCPNTNLFVKKVILFSYLYIVLL